MMLAVEFYSDEIGYEFSKEMYNHKVIIAGTLNNAETIRFEPPRVLTEEEICHRDPGGSRIRSQSQGGHETLTSLAVSHTITRPFILLGGKV